MPLLRLRHRRAGVALRCAACQLQQAAPGECRQEAATRRWPAPSVRDHRHAGDPLGWCVSGRRQSVLNQARSGPAEASASCLRLSEVEAAGSSASQLSLRGGPQPSSRIARAALAIHASEEGVESHGPRGVKSVDREWSPMQRLPISRHWESPPRLYCTALLYVAAHWRLEVFSFVPEIQK